MIYYSQIQPNSKQKNVYQAVRNGTRAQRPFTPEIEPQRQRVNSKKGSSNTTFNKLPWLEP